MKTETFRKRFDFPIGSLKGLLFAVIQGKNGKNYYITVNKKGEPIAKKQKQ